MDTISFGKDVAIQKQSIQDLLSCAFEGGSNYWYGKLEPLDETIVEGHPSDRFYRNIMKHGFRLFDTFGEKTYEIIPVQFETALKLMYNNHPRHFNDLNYDNFDAETGDVFLQLLCFEKVIYG